MPRRKDSSNLSILLLTAAVEAFFFALESHIWVSATVNLGANLGTTIGGNANPGPPGGRNGGKPAYNAAPLVPIRAPQSSYPVPLPQDEPGDPTDEQINSPLYFFNDKDKFIYEDNPCDGYHEYGKYNSKKNKARRRGCGHARDRLKKYLGTKVHGRVPRAERCNTVQDSRCFEFKGKASRCYVKVNVNENKGSYVLINNC